MSKWQIVPITAVMMLGSAMATAGDGWFHLGEPLTIEKVTPIQEIIDNPAAFHDREVRIEGQVASVCNEEGCFIEVAPKTGDGEGIVVNFPGLLHTFPLDCAALEVTVEGRFYQKVYPHARVNHWQHHSFRPGIEVPDYSLVFRLDARGARLGGTRSAPPPPAAIRSSSADRVNLGLMGFEAEGFGIDRRSIAPGEVVPRPSTGGNRWMVLCREGEVVVHRGAAKVVPLRAGEMSFIPAGEVFKVRNSSDHEASFDLVYTKKVEPPSHSHSR